MKVLNAKDYGIPQNRERVFIVSIREDIQKGMLFPKGFDNGLRLKDFLEDKVDDNYYLSEKIVKYFIENTKKQKENGNGFKFEPTDGNNFAKTIRTKAGARMDDNFLIEVGNLNYSKFEQDNRVYSANGVAPTLRAGNKNNLIECSNLESKTICLNSKVNGKQPSLQDRIYDSDGISTAITTCFMPSILIGAIRGRNLTIQATEQQVLKLNKC